MSGPADEVAVVALPPLRWRALWLGVWAFGWVLCLVLSLAPSAPGPGLFPHADKLQHFFAYLMLAWWAMGCFASTGGRRRALLALLVLGAAIEWAQGAFTVDRQRDAFDMLANAAGVGLGTAFGLWLSLPAWLEARLRR